VRLLAWESEAEAERLEADGALGLVLDGLACGDDRERGDVHGGVGMGRMRFAGSSGGGGVGGIDGLGSVGPAKDGLEGLEGCPRGDCGARGLGSETRGGVCRSQRQLMRLVRMIGRGGRVSMASRYPAAV